VPDRDHYEAYYAAKLWALLPGFYRSEDAATLDGVGPLREIVNRIGGQAAILRRGIDRLWEDQSIETCDDWVISYIGDLLATNLVASLDARGQRLDVAKTIYYRRRKGTLGILEEIAADITGWDARVVEFFRRMGRTRHGLDPAIGPMLGVEFADELQAAQGLIGPRTHTGIGGWADLRNRYGAEKAHTAFDEFFHMADFRRGVGHVGWYDIPRLGVFLWRLISFSMDQTTPVPLSGCPGHFTFDPTGRFIPLFAAASRREAKQFGDKWIPPDEWQLPTQISTALLDAELANLYPRSVAVFRQPGAEYVLVPAASVKIYPELGRFRFTGPGPVFGTYHYGFSAPIGAGPYDRRKRGVDATPVPLPETVVAPAAAINAAPAGTTTIDDSLTHTSAANLSGITEATIRAQNERRPVLRLTPGAEWRLGGAADSTLFLDGLFVSGGDVVLEGDFDTVTLRCVTFDPGSEGAPPDVFQKSADGRNLVPTHLWVEGRVRNLVLERSILGPIRTRNNGLLENLEITDSILQGLRTSAVGPLTASEIKDATRVAARLRDTRDPLSQFIQGGFPQAVKDALAAYDSSSPPTATLQGQIVSHLNDLITGPSIFTADRFAGVRLSAATQALLASNPTGADLVRLNRLLLEDAFPLELADAAVSLAEGDVDLKRVTVLGRALLHHLDASEVILDDLTFVEDPQSGCVRFSAWSTGSIIPRHYESVEIAPRSPLFTTRVFGQPGYAQLQQNADRAVLDPPRGVILTGAQNGSEMGTFSDQKNAIKERSLLIKYREFMPLGLVPVVFYVDA
jgi:hypothetical protein